MPDTVRGTGWARGKKTAEAIQEEVAAEIARLLEVAFGGLRKERRIDLEALEMATRAAMHRAGATVLEELLDADKDAEREVTCRCGQHARFHEMRPKQILTALGRIEIQRPYYVCNHCHQGQSPRDRELDVEGTEYSPALRRMIALVGSEGSFEQGRQQLDQLAGLQVTTKAVERQAEAIGQDIAEREQVNIERAVQLDLPEIASQNISVMYVEMDGTGVPCREGGNQGTTREDRGTTGAHTRGEARLCVHTNSKR